MEPQKEKRHYKEEKKMKNSPPVPIEKSEIINKQLKLFICKINKNESFGTGFFCKIPFFESKLLPVLITNNHILEEDEIKVNKTIKISFDNDKIIRELVIGPERRTYTNIDYDITVIEIFPTKDNITHFLDCTTDITILERIKKINGYVLQYPEKYQCSVAYGSIYNISEYEIKHKISTHEGSSGGPIIILEDIINSLNDMKVLGIHKGYDEEYNLGTLLQYPISEFDEIFKNEIRIKIKIEDDDINKDVYLINYHYFINKDGIECEVEQLKEINSSNIIMSINGEKCEFQKYKKFNKKRRILNYFKIQK